MANLKIDFCGVEFKNPTVLASGVLGVTASSLKNVVRNGAGGVSTKSIWLEEHKGHASPVMFGTEHFFMNAVGVPDAGIKKASEETFPEYNKDKTAPIIANIIASKVSDFEQIAEEITKCDPDIIEVNISCPNVEDEFGKPFACSVIDSSAVTKVVKKITGKPVIIKLSPNVDNFVEIAVKCMEVGADGLCLFNTFGPGLAIDIDLRRPILKNKVGGVSGPGLKPLVVKKIHDVYKATKAPIIGTGSVLNGRDAIELMMVGARLVGMGTMVYYRGVEGFGQVVKEINEWCDENGVKDLKEIIGIID